MEGTAALDTQQVMSVAPVEPACIPPPEPENKGPSRDAVDDVPPNVRGWFDKRNGDTLQGALAFVPWILQQAYFESANLESQIVIHRGKGAVAFMDASGFTQLTEQLAKRSNGAEMLSHCLKGFFTPLIDLIHAYHGDVIKFSGNALNSYWPDVDDTQSPKYNNIVPPHGTYGLPDLGPMATACLRASACCIEVHKRLHNHDPGVEGVRLCLHIGVGCGTVFILQVGGEQPPETHIRRFEYLIAGNPLEQISIAEPLAKNGETCLSPQTWHYVKDCVIEGSPLEDRPDYHLLHRMDESKYTFPTIKHAAMENDNRPAQQFRLAELKVIRQYVPSAVFKQIECGTLRYVNEMRHISVIFVNGGLLDVMTDRGAQRAQELMAAVQRTCYAHEGTLNKFLIDDKGMGFLIVFGLPPLVHTDDPTRAVLACLDMVKVFKAADLVGKFGVTTGRSYCGVCGSEKRMEYTVLGDMVNLAARLMQSAPPMGVLVDEETKNRVSGEITISALAPIKVWSKSEKIPIFQPESKEHPPQIGLVPGGKVRFPWYDSPYGGSSSSVQGSSALQTNVQQLCSVKTWKGIERVSEMLGGAFTKTMHQSDTTVQWSAPTVQPPAGSPFDKGGAVVIEGPTGMGKIELAEQIVMYSALRFQVMPVFGSMGPRPGDSVRLGVELIRSTLGVFRHTNPQVPNDDFQALTHVVPPAVADSLPRVREALNEQVLRDRASEVLDVCLNVVCALLGVLAHKVPVCVVLQFETGTSLFPKTYEVDQNIFWRAVARLSKFMKGEGNVQGNKPIVMLVLCRERDRTSPAVKMAEQSNTHLLLRGLTEENIVEYMSNYLAVPEQMIPGALRQFVAKVTLGNPLYIRETIDQLQENGNIQVVRGANRQPRNLECKDIEKINISSWQHTSMVGGTICQLEALDPLESAVLKMSTCFIGPFTLPDLAASSCSQWAEATRFDYLRLFKAIKVLQEKTIIEAVDAPASAESPRKAHGNTQYFQTRNVLIRAVGSSMVLEATRKSVKRQALMDRVLARELPQRMETLYSKRNAQHIPWYYEQAFRRM